MDFAGTKSLFHLPSGVIYLDGNSLGPLPKTTMAKLEHVTRHEWGETLITAWNGAGWMSQPSRLGDRIGRLIGAKPGSVVVGDTLSIKVYQALAAAIDLQPDRNVILSEPENFPSDLYMAQGLIGSLDRGLTLKCVTPDKIPNALEQNVAALLLTEVNYRTGRLHNMQELTQMARENGVLTVWDLAHSAGAIPVDVARAGVDFAVGCTYKYLNAGPGAPAFIYVAPKLHDHIRPALSGWLGHQAPFAFDPDYHPGPGIERMRVGTPPVLQMAALEAALDIWDTVDMQDIRARSIVLSELFIEHVERQCPQVNLVSPRDPNQRGSQVSFAVDDAYPVVQALIARGVIGDFRAPDLMRFGFAPLFIDEQDVENAATILADILSSKSWDRPEFKKRAFVT